MEGNDGCLNYAYAYCLLFVLPMCKGKICLWISSLCSRYAA